MSSFVTWLAGRTNKATPDDTDEYYVGDSGTSKRTTWASFKVAILAYVKDKTAITGMLKGNGTAISAATAGTDYSAGTSALATGMLKSTTTTGALTIGVAGTDYSAGTAALATGIVKSTTTTGALTIAVNSDLPAMSATVGGAVPTPPNNTTDFLRGDGTWAVPAGGSGSLTQYYVGVGDASNLLSGSAALTFGAATGQGLLATAGTATTDVKALDITQTWNNAGVAFRGARIVITDTASAAGSLPFSVLGGAAGSTNLFSVSKAGAISSPYFTTTASGIYPGAGAGTDVRLIGGSLNSIYLATGALHIATGGSDIAIGKVSDLNTGIRVNGTSGLLTAQNNFNLVGYQEGAEMTAPSAPSANRYRLFAQDNGAGKTQLMVIFASGAAQQVAIEP